MKNITPFLLIGVLLAVHPVIGDTECDKASAVKAQPEDCCQFLDLFDDDILSSCSQEAAEQHIEEKIHDQSDLRWLNNMCVIECTLNKTGLIDGSKIKASLMKDYLDNLAEENPEQHGVWKESVDHAIEACYDTPSDGMKAKITAMMEHHMQATNIAADLCVNVGSILLDCLYVEMFKTCPGSMFNKEGKQECVDYQNYVKTCSKW